VGATLLAEAAQSHGDSLTLGPNGFALLEIVGTASVSDALPVPAHA
jgi:hypothetical protein